MDLDFFFLLKVVTLGIYPELSEAINRTLSSLQDSLALCMHSAGVL